MFVLFMISSNSSHKAPLGDYINVQERSSGCSKYLSECVSEALAEPIRSWPSGHYHLIFNSFMGSGPPHRLNACDQSARGWFRDVGSASLASSDSGVVDCSRFVPVRALQPGYKSNIPE